MSDKEKPESPPQRPTFSDIRASLRAALARGDEANAWTEWGANARRRWREYEEARAAWERQNPKAAAILRRQEAAEETLIMSAQEEEWRRWGYLPGSPEREVAERRMREGAAEANRRGRAR